MCKTQVRTDNSNNIDVFLVMRMWHVWKLALVGRCGKRWWLAAVVRVIGTVSWRRWFAGVMEWEMAHMVGDEDGR